MLGTKDSSTRQQPATQEARPQHVPFFFTFGQKGPLDAQFVSGAEAQALYGADTFDTRKKYATHATEFINRNFANGGSAIIQRLETPDAHASSSLRFWADVLETTVQDYVRNDDGSIKVVAGSPVPAGPPIPGFKVKFLVSQVAPDEDGVDTFGMATQAAGDQTDADTQEQSVRIPLMDLRVPSFGTHGDNSGLRLWAPTTGGRNPVDAHVVANEKAYPFRLALVQRADELSSPSIYTTLSGAQSIDFSLMPGAYDRKLDRSLYLGDVFLEQYQNVSSATGAVQYSPFDQLHVYDDQIADLLEKLYVAEVAQRDEFSDFAGTNAADEMYRFNLFGGTTSRGVRYHSYQIVTGSGGAVRLAENSNLMASGGTEGVMNNDVYAELVEAACAQFADPKSPLKDMAKYPYSAIYDTGFPLDAKKALCQILAQRKNTWVALATHVVGGRPLTAAEETTMATTLLAHVQMYPESEYFGTSCTRGILIGGSGRYMGSNFRKDLPLTLELLDKVSDYTGAANGEWKSASRFDVDDGRNVKLFTNLNVNTRTDDTRDTNWVIGLVTPESSDRKQYYFPAFQTVYDRDDSVLNSLVTMLAIADLQMIGEETRRKFSGRSDLSNLEFIDEVNKFMAKRIAGRYDNRFIIQAQAYITAEDEARGYSWTTNITIGAPGMKTVQTLSIEGQRIEEMQ
jgi:hypothetical protein